MHSNAFHDIMGRPPRKLVSIGTTVAFLAFAGIIAVLWSVSYTDKAKGRLRMTTKMPPVAVKAQAGGYVILDKSEGEVVIKGEELGMMRNPADRADVTTLEQIVTNLMEYNKDDYLYYIHADTLNVGSIQSAFDKFNETISDFVLVENDRSDETEISRIIRKKNTDKRSVAYLEETIQKLEEKLEIMSANGKEEAQKQFNRDNDRTAYYNYLSEIKDVQVEITKQKANLASLKAQVEGSALNILSEKIKVKNGSNNKLQEIRSALNLLKNAIDKWKNDYLILAPASGTVTYYDTQINASPVAQGQDILAIIPQQSEETDIIGKMKLPLKGAGKVETGQPVQIRFDIYPYLEYGFVRGIVKSKSLLPGADEEQYSLDIALPVGLVTTKSDTLRFRQNMLADAEIITEESRLLTRIFGKFF